MSNSLLNKSIKYLQGNNKRTKKSEKQRLKKKKAQLNLSFLKEEEYKNNILKNLQLLGELKEEDSVKVPQEILPNYLKNRKEEYKSDEEIEEPTVFTDKDFEDFEKEYFGS